MENSSLLIVGANGQLGLALQAKYPNAQAADADRLDITNESAVLNYDWSNIKIIVNAAAYTDVDRAETPKGRVAAWRVNATGAANLSRAAIAHDLTLVHISTDYVFDGTENNHMEDEPFSPLGVYGQSKAAGDVAVSLTLKHYILRTSWVIGGGKNFVRTMLALGQKGVNPDVVSDQIGRLTFTDQLVCAIDQLVGKEAPAGIYNMSGSGTPASWASITREIFELAGYRNTVTDVTTEQYFQGKTGIAPRPRQSTLDLSKLQATGFAPQDWRKGLAEYVQKELRK